MTGIEGVLATDAARARLARFLARAMAAGSVRILEAVKLSGGSVQESWVVEVEGAGAPDARQRWVLRADSPTRLAASRGRAEEFALLRAAFAAGVLVPEPLCCCDDPAVLGRPFFVMRWAPGVADGHRIVRDIPEDRRAALAETLGRELVKIHALAAADPSTSAREEPSPEHPELVEGSKARPAGAARRRLAGKSPYQEDAVPATISAMPRSMGPSTGMPARW